MATDTITTKRSIITAGVVRHGQTFYAVGFDRLTSATLNLSLADCERLALGRYVFTGPCIKGNVSAKWALAAAKAAVRRAVLAETATPGETEARLTAHLLTLTPAELEAWPRAPRAFHPAVNTAKVLLAVRKQRGLYTRVQNPRKKGVR